MSLIIPDHIWEQSVFKTGEDYVAKARVRVATGIGFYTASNGMGAKLRKAVNSW